MKENSWHLIKLSLDSYSHQNVVKGIISHITDIKDNEILDVVYLEYLDNDAITSIINDDIIDLLEKQKKIRGNY
ncbi:hypothetical protein [Staphylococcus felis]|uniref:Uncharacterized protein n=1 Tax=Staphylococcus felis TaxID=46127 RepID=A0A3E0IL33_9STAP|nr:hypothetical protein [Staphylococcus felis]REH87453.1 hypothetical protein DOS61_00755 [Staphylococcus felis]REH89676.1 hypothetical protein DOS83_13095 [Staphylococcus felis]